MKLLQSTLLATFIYSTQLLCTTLDQQLLHAAKNHNTEHVIELLNQGANVNAADALGRTPLMYACDSWFTRNAFYILLAYLSSNKTFENQEQLVHILIQANADVHAKDNQGNSPLSVADCAFNDTSGNSGVNSSVIKMLQAAGAIE